LAIAVGILACKENYPVAFRTVAGLINEMVEARNENRLSIYIKQLRKIDILIIDVLGYVTFDITATELLFSVACHAIRDYEYYHHIEPVIFRLGEGIS